MSESEIVDLFNLIAEQIEKFPQRCDCAGGCNLCLAHDDLIMTKMHLDSYLSASAEGE